jgi:hypothetical protein
MSADICFELIAVEVPQTNALAVDIQSASMNITCVEANLMFFYFLKFSIISIEKLRFVS